MCGRFYVPEDASIQMIRAIVERLEHRNVKVKTGDVFPGDMAAVVASNRQMQPQPFAMEWGYHLTDGKRIINARSETAAQKVMFADGIRQRRCLIPARHYYEWEKADGRKVKYAIEPKNSDGFFLAGIYRLEAGRPVFTVLTRDAAEDMQSLLKSQRKEDVDINWKKRPDLVIGSGFSVSSTCIEEADANDVFCISKILIIELKKGGFTIGRGEVVQAEEYIDSIYRGNKLNCKPKIKAYVVGDSVSPAIGTHKTLENYGEVYVYTYAQLVQTASKRLFNLKNKLIERYQEMNAKDYISEILNEPKQTELVLL